MSILIGDITILSSGVPPPSLGILSSIVSIDRSPFITGPVPLATGVQGQFQLDTSDIPGSYHSIVVSSSIHGTSQSVFGEWTVYPVIVWAEAPLDLADCKAAIVCPKCLMFVPKHAQTIVEGLAYWRKVAPVGGTPGPGTMAPPPGILVIPPNDPNDPTGMGNTSGQFGT